MPRYCPVEQGHTGRMYSPCPEHRALEGVDQRSWSTRVTSQGKQGVQVLPLRETRWTGDWLLTLTGRDGPPQTTGCSRRGGASINAIIQFVCNVLFQERVQAKDPPAHYLNKLRTYLDPKASRSSRVSTPAMFP
uniref:Uncharacterized protein n=1 Tax=Timema cristinae TaxID=61476 RepID=A0A7R9CM99_TIMCR|nr:unnamed protein product [Timema cristinae]